MKNATRFLMLSVQTFVRDTNMRHTGQTCRHHASHGQQDKPGTTDQQVEQTLSSSETTGVVSTNGQQGKPGTIEKQAQNDQQDKEDNMITSFQT